MWLQMFRTSQYGIHHNTTLYTLLTLAITDKIDQNGESILAPRRGIRVNADLKPSPVLRSTPCSFNRLWEGGAW